MRTTTQLRAQRNELARQIHEINDRYPVDKPLPAEESKKVDDLLDQVTAIDEAIAQNERAARLLADDPQAQHEAALNVATRTPGAHVNSNSPLRAYLQGGLMALTTEQRNEMAARQSADIRNAMSTTTATEGGYTTAPESMRSLEIAMKAYGGLLRIATSIQSATGTTMNFPTADATGEEGEIVGQNTPVTALDTPFGNIAVDVYKYSSKSIALPFELIQDTFLDIEAYIQAVLATRLGRILAKHAVNGTGVGQPRGLVTAAAVGVTGATGQTTTVTYDNLVDLEHSVDPAYRAMTGVGYLMSDDAVKMVRKIKDSQQRPIFVPGYEANAMVNGGAPDMLMGKPIYIDQAVPVPAASAKSIAFGKLDKYLVRRVMDLTMFRMMDSAYTLKGQVGFVAFQRMGGNFVDVGGAVKLYQHSAT